MTVRADAQKSVTYERDDDGIGWITLRRERVLNAIDSAMMRDLASALDAFDKDDSAQVAVMSGSGRAFCVGADIKEVRTHVAQDGESDLKRLPDLLLVRDRYKPIVAAAHGHVVGAGLRLVLLSDFALCAGSTQFRVPEVDHGLDGAPYWLLLQARAGDAFAADVVGTCPECSAVVVLDTDVRELCMAELRFLAASVYDDVNLLASVYRWTQDAILDLPSARRRRYADMIAGRSPAELGVTVA